MRLNIDSYCIIRNGKATLNENEFFTCDLIGSEFLAALYKASGIDYRKFFKMDNLSKLGFLASELLLTNCAYTEEEKENTAVIFWNSSASTDIDKTYQKTIEHADNYYPSPAEFVYTLPNVVMGEIAIRNKMYGETMFYIAEKFDGLDVFNKASYVLADNDVSGVLCGRVEYLDGDYEAVVFLVKRNDLCNMAFNETNINQIYNYGRINPAT